LFPSSSAPIVDKRHFPSSRLRGVILKEVVR